MWSLDGAVARDWLTVKHVDLDPGPAEQYAEPTQDPPPEVALLAVGDTLLAYGVVAGGAAGDTVSARFDAPDGSVVGPWEVVYEAPGRLSVWSWALTLPDAPGQWQVVFLVNGVPVDTMSVMVE